MNAAFLRENPELQPLVLSNVQLTGKKIGAGAYGSVEEVKLPKRIGAAKKIHDIFQDPNEVSGAVFERASRQFVIECRLLNDLRHPHIVEFLGVCFLPGSRLPALVMERLKKSLHELLDPETSPEDPSAKHIPLSQKRSILHDVAEGLSFLHNRAAPIIHRDLTARNVLLNSDMVAKIADLGMARIVPSQIAATMTKAPGAAVYMPPEALEDESRYDMTIDIFCFGVLAVFVISQTFPKPLPAAYMDATRKMVGRTELERRANYMQQIQNQLQSGHPLIVMIEQCLKNLPEDRPTVLQVAQLLDQAKTEEKHEEETKMIENEEDDQEPTTDEESNASEPEHPVENQLAPLEVVGGGRPAYYTALPALLIAGLAILVYFGGQWFLEPAVNRPLPLTPAVSSEWRNDSEYGSRLWGTYRSNIYFGVRPRIPHSLMAGIMWYTHDQFKIRHTCDNRDHLRKYGWTRHDGTTFGEQQIVDKNLMLETDFLTLGETWTARIKGRPLKSSQRPVLTSLIVYLYKEGNGEMTYNLSREGSVEEVNGHTPELQQYHFYIPHKTIPPEAHHSFLSAHITSIAYLEVGIASVLKEDWSHPLWPLPLYALPGELTSKNMSTNLVAYQVTTTIPFEMDIVMETGMFNSTLSGENLTKALREKARMFDERFEKTFHLKAKGLNETEISFAKAAFSNLIGGMAYFHGQSKVMAKNLPKPMDYWPASLYTAVPSRSSFPRGFLWDEGFHQLLVAHWDITITKDVLAHWLDLLNTEGWIPREQILGDEARSKVPAEFIVQHNENANPPTFFLTMETLLQRMEEEGKVDRIFLHHIFPRLEVWFDWFNTMQAGFLPLTYRWRGRNTTTDRELIPKTMTSGLDDYPRSSHPSSSEYHVDLYCWMALASGVMARVADILGMDSSDYWHTHKSLTDVNTLNRLHWDEEEKMYSDYGEHTSSIELVKATPPSPNLPPLIRREVKKKPEPRFVNSFGYVSLFPFLLKIVPPTSHQLGIILKMLQNTSLLWTEYGLRSLAKTDPFYNKRNTEHDHPCWRGAIWINMNYLAVRALHHYGNTNGPYKDQAKKLYSELRLNLIRNMHQQYLKTGYVWQQYDDRLGKGKGIHPFTGWSSLIVLIMAEKY